MFKKILMICVGNICRSPMASALLAEKLKIIDQDITVSSAGIAALVNAPAHAYAKALMLQRGIDLSTHRARQATPELLLDADLILTMETRQSEQLEYILPSIRGRIHRLGKWGDFDIADPYQRQESVFEHVLALIEEGITQWQRKLWA